jgi:hypothetical protein
MADACRRESRNRDRRNLRPDGAAQQGSKPPRCGAKFKNTLFINMLTKIKTI